MATATTKTMNMNGSQQQQHLPNPGDIKISLHRRQGSLSHYQSTCISKHYALNNQILAAFESHYRNELLKVAYHLGLKFIETALFEIPKHGYFYAHKHSALRLQSSVDAIRVTQLLQAIIAREASFATECVKIERLSYLANEQYERLPTYESKRIQVEQELYPASEIAFQRSSSSSSSRRGSRRGSGYFAPNSSSSSSGGRNSNNASYSYNYSSSNNASGNYNADPLTSTILACGDSFAAVFCPTGPAAIDKDAAAAEYKYKSNPPPFPEGQSHHPDYSHPHFPNARSSISKTASIDSSSSYGGSVRRLEAASAAAEAKTNDFADELDSSYKFPPTPTEQKQQRLLLQEQRQPSFDDQNLYPSHSRSSPSTVNNNNNNNFNNSNSDSSRFKLKLTGSLLDDDTEDDYKCAGHSSFDGTPLGAPVPPDVEDGIPINEGEEIATGIPISPEEEEEEKGQEPSFYKTQQQQDQTQYPRTDEQRMREKLLLADPSDGSYTMTNPPRHVRSESDYDLKRALFLSGLGVELETHRHPSEESMRIIPEEPSLFAPPGARKKDDEDAGLSIALLGQCHHEDFDALRDSGRVIVSYIPTYQGRVPDSTNGCTVIAPLLCLHHFHDSDAIPDNGLQDQIIVEVLDEETPNILPLVREKLGLVQDAFLIPADAHEALMEEQYMCPDQFYSVCGGNILEEEHLDAFVKELATIGDKKLAATFFFHEHVITILQLKRSSNKVWFDLINSLPHREMFMRAGDTSVLGQPGDCRNSMQEPQIPLPLQQQQQISEEFDPPPPPTQALSMRLSSDGLNFGEDEFMVDSIPPENTCRIRCLDAESLKATLRWYACSSFTHEQEAYIDTYQWDENLWDFDPRVFQAFLWTEA